MINFKHNVPDVSPIVTRRIYTSKGIDLFCTKLRDVDWSSINNCNDCQEAYSLFHEVFGKLYSDCFPIQTFVKKC